MTTLTQEILKELLHYRIGIFHTPELAHAAYVKTKRKLHRGCSI